MKFYELKGYSQEQLIKGMAGAMFSKDVIFGFRPDLTVQARLQLRPLKALVYNLKMVRFNFMNGTNLSLSRIKES